jgi:hypothetical protein
MGKHWKRSKARRNCLAVIKVLRKNHGVEVARESRRLRDMLGKHFFYGHPNRPVQARFPQLSKEPLSKR